MEANKAKYALLLSKLKSADSEHVQALAKGIATEVTESIVNSNKALSQDLRSVFAELAVELAALSRRMDEAESAPKTDFDKLFGELRDSMPKEAVASLSDDQINTIAEHIGITLSETVSKLNLELARTNLADEVVIKDLKPMIEKVVAKIPKKIDGKVTLAYNKASAKDYVNVRLTDGQAFVDSMVSAARGVGLPLIKVAGDVMALPVVNPDGSFIGGGGAAALSDDLVLMEYHTGNDNLIYVGTAANGSAEADEAWSILRMDLTNLLAVTYAPNYLTNGDAWDSRESLFA